MAVLFGGRSAEHSVSIQSARSVVAALDRHRFDLVLVGIDRTGRWFLYDEQSLAAIDKEVGGRQRLQVLPHGLNGGLALVPNRSRTARRTIAVADVVFPVLHGPYGEDGALQGMLEMFGAPYVGCGVLASAICMDKDVQKRLLAASGLPVVPWETVTRRSWRQNPTEVMEKARRLGLPLYVKPANLGSSVGITKVSEMPKFPPAIRSAFRYDTKVVIEHGIDAREIECSVLGNHEPRASIPGEIEPGAAYYSYAAKYGTRSRSRLLIPAPIPSDLAEQVREFAIRAFQVTQCTGMARVDFLLDRQSGALYVNEINTIPGFTSISMYPKLWEASGLSYRELLTGLVELALERHRERAVLAVS